MNAIKTALHNTIDQLSDEDAQRLLDVAQQLQRQEHRSSVLHRLAHDATFRLPATAQPHFDSVEPTQGVGIDASVLLLGDRR